MFFLAGLFRFWLCRLSTARKASGIGRPPIVENGMTHLNSITRAHSFASGAHPLSEGFPFLSAVSHPILFATFKAGKVIIHCQADFFPPFWGQFPLDPPSSLFGVPCPAKSSTVVTPKHHLLADSPRPPEAPARPSFPRGVAPPVPVNRSS